MLQAVLRVLCCCDHLSCLGLQWLNTARHSWCRLVIIHMDSSLRSGRKLCRCGDKVLCHTDIERRRLPNKNRQHNTTPTLEKCMFMMLLCCCLMDPTRAWMPARPCTSMAPSTPTLSLISTAKRAAASRELYAPLDPFSIVNNAVVPTSQQGRMLSMSSTSTVVDSSSGSQPLWLGLDLSTQSLTGAVLKGDAAGGVHNDPVLLESINFEARDTCNLVLSIPSGLPLTIVAVLDWHLSKRSKSHMPLTH